MLFVINDIIVMSGCSLSHLLKRSIDLIDPGRHHQSSTVESGGTATTTTTDTTQNQNDAPSTANHNNNNKTVSFSSSCAPPNKLISVNDVKQAYDLLLHATSMSISSSSPPLTSDGNIQHNNTIVNEHSSWNDLSILADIYRALIVASNLLLELLPHDDSSSSSDTNNTTQDEQSTKQQQQSSCPLQCLNNDDDHILSLTQATIKDILSTIRRSILLLQLLEHVCAIKSISQRRRYNNSSNGKDLQYEGSGDDIHDYDRSMKDLISNYDWHDDGYLPQPFTHYDIVDNVGTTATNGNDKKDVQSSNILLECCYRPTYPSDPPSSKHERNAYTRDWIRGDRIVSLCIDDYQYFDDDGSSMKEVVNNDIGVEDDSFSNTTDNLDLNDQADDTDNSAEEEHGISLNLSKAEFEEEEGYLIDIMLADNVQQQNKSTQRSKAQVKRIAKERKKRKRQNKNKRKQDARCQQLEEQLDVTSDASTVMTNQVKPQSHTREGFLLLICEDKPLNILQHIQNKTSPCNNDNNRRTKSIRIYVTLHPSGLLTIEDCSIRKKEKEVEEEGPLISRTRYLDLFIGTQTKCQPCIPDGTSSFKFQLSNIHLLGASTTSSPSSQSTTSTSLNEQINIMLSVDEGTGGNFMDGFEWVNTISGAANTKSSLIESIESEWGEE